MAEPAVDSMQRDFDPEDYEDTYRESVLEPHQAQGGGQGDRPRPSRRSPSTGTTSMAALGRPACGGEDGALKAWPRALWSGSLSFGLVNVPVQLLSAARDLDYHFHQLHAKDKAPHRAAPLLLGGGHRGQLGGDRQQLRPRRQGGRGHRRGAGVGRAAQDADHRHRGVRRPGRGRPDLLRPPLLPRARRRERGHAARLPPAGRGDGRAGARRARTVRDANQGVPRGCPGARRGAGPHDDALPRRGQAHEPHSDRRQETGEACGRRMPSRSSRSSRPTGIPRATPTATASG